MRRATAEAERPPLFSFIRLEFPSSEEQRAVVIEHDRHDSSRFQVRTLVEAHASRPIRYDSRGFAMTGTTWCQTHPPIGTGVKIIVNGLTHTARVDKLLEHPHFELSLGDGTRFDSESLGRLGIDLRFLQPEDSSQRGSSHPDRHGTSKNLGSSVQTTVGGETASRIAVKTEQTVEVSLLDGHGASTPLKKDIVETPDGQAATASVKTENAILVQMGQQVPPRNCVPELESSPFPCGNAAMNTPATRKAKREPQRVVLNESTPASPDVQFVSMTPGWTRRKSAGTFCSLMRSTAEQLHDEAPLNSTFGPNGAKTMTCTAEQEQPVAPPALESAGTHTNARAEEGPVEPPLCSSDTACKGTPSPRDEKSESELQTNSITYSPAKPISTQQHKLKDSATCADPIATEQNKFKNVTTLGKRVSTVSPVSPGKRPRVNPGIGMQNATPVSMPEDSASSESEIEPSDDEKDDDDEDYSVESEDSAASEDASYPERDGQTGRCRGEGRDLPLGTLVAEFDESDIPVAPGPPISEKGSDADSSDAGLEGKSSTERRIIKMLRLHLHPDTSEHEAKQAMRAANVLMTRHNISVVEMQKAAKADCSPQLDCGLVKIRLSMRATKNRANLYNWIRDLASVVADNFEVDFFTDIQEKNRRYPNGLSAITMYGLRVNAQLAAYAFSSFFDRIQVMSQKYNVSDTEYDKYVQESVLDLYECKTMSRAVFSRVARRSYVEGMVSRMRKTVKETIAKRKAERLEALEKARRRAEALEKALRRGEERTKPYQQPPLSSSNGCEEGSVHGEQNELEMFSEENVIDGYAVEDVERARAAAKEAKEEVAKLEKEEENAQTLVVVTKSAPARALDQAGIKLYSGRRRRVSDLRNPTAYRQGRTDAAGFDLNRQAVEGEASGMDG